MCGWLFKANLEYPIRFFVHFSKTLMNLNTVKYRRISLVYFLLLMLFPCYCRNNDSYHRYKTLYTSDRLHIPLHTIHHGATGSENDPWHK